MSTVQSLFISHGAPTFALLPGRAGALLGEIGAHLPPLAASLVVSPHWQTTGLHVMTHPEPGTWADFGGFPQALFALDYPAPGHPELARALVEHLQSQGIAAQEDAQRPRDHGAWVPLMHLLPLATTPVFQLSMPHTLDAAGAWALGVALRGLREQGVLVVGSGSLTHNLGDLQMTPEGMPVEGAPTLPYAQAFASWAREQVTGGHGAALVDYRAHAPHAARAHPTEEHYLPLLIAMAAAGAAATPEVLDGGFTYGALAMESYAWRA